MAENGTFTIHLEHLNEFEFNVRFDWDDVVDLLLDEPEPLGHANGPNASRIVGAAVGNCLSASLLFCLQKAKVELTGMRAEVQGTMTRNERGRMRIGGFEVRILLDGVAQQRERLNRCLKLFEDYCVVTDSIRSGVPVEVAVLDETGHDLLADVS